MYRFHHVHLICNSLRDTEGFFVNMLGASLVERKKFGTTEGSVLDLDGTTINLRVERKEDAITCDSSQKRYGYDHLAFEVKDLDAIYRQLNEKGCVFPVPVKITEDGKVAFFKGPDNIRIELFQPP